MAGFDNMSRVRPAQNGMSRLVNAFSASCNAARPSVTRPAGSKRLPKRRSQCATNGRISSAAAMVRLCA
jgi:hypothetical protein